MSEWLIKNLHRSAIGGLVSRRGTQVWTPGEWVTHGAPLVLCEHGLHANYGATLSHAFRRASCYVFPLGGVWRVEVDGEVLRDTDKICAQRMRLVEPIDRTEAFRAAWPDSDPSRLDDVDAAIELARGIDWSACIGSRDATDVVRAFGPWRRTVVYAAADVSYTDVYTAAYVAAYAAGASYTAAFDAASAAAAAFDAASAYAAASDAAAGASDADAAAAYAAADGASHAAVAAGYAAVAAAARYAYAQAVASHDPRVRHANPFLVLLQHCAAGGTWQDVVVAWVGKEGV